MKCVYLRQLINGCFGITLKRVRNRKGKVAKGNQVEMDGFKILNEGYLK